MMSRKYKEYPVNAGWLLCDMCSRLGREVRAVMRIKVEVKGDYGRKGSRSLGYYCELHGRAKLNRLRAKERRLGDGDPYDT
jgi:hypothetical protein